MRTVRTVRTRGARRLLTSIVAVLGLSGALAGPAPVAAAPAAVPTAGPTTAGPSAAAVDPVAPFRGLGAWLDVLDWSPTYTNGANGFHHPAGVDAMAARGVQTLYIQTSRFNRAEDVLDPALLGQIIDRAHADGMRVVAWYLPTHTDPATDLRRLVAAANLPVDGVGVDIESTAQADVPTRNANLVQLSQDLRAATAKPLVAIVLPPVVTDVLNPAYWPQFPWTTLGPSYDAWMPMGYWSNRTPASGWNDGYRYTAENIDRVRAHLQNPAAPVHAVGGIANQVTAAQVADMVRASTERGTIGGSLYDFQTTGADLWSPLQAFRDGPPPAPWAAHSSVVSATSADRRLELFARDPRGGLIHSWQLTPNGTWSAWQWMGVFISGTPTVATNEDGRLEVWATDTRGGLIHSWQLAPNGTWSAWQWTGAFTAHAPAAARAPDGRLELFAGDRRGGLIHSWQLTPNGTWSPWQWMGAFTAGPPAVAPGADGRLELFAPDPGGALRHSWQLAPNGTWSGWVATGIDTFAAPTIGTAPDGRLEVFASLPDRRLVHSWQTAPDGPWSPWASRGASTTGPPAGGTAPDGRLELFAVDLAGRLIHSWQLTPNGGWSAWTSRGATVTGSPTVARAVDARLELFAIDTRGGLIHSWQLSPGGGWGAWQWTGVFVR